MATINATRSFIGAKDGSLLKFLWEGLVTGSLDGTPVASAEWSDRSVQFTGTWDTATVVMQGSNDGGTSWFELNDFEGTAVSSTAGTPIWQIVEMTELMRPLMSSAGASSDIDVHLVARRTNNLRT